MWPMVLNQTNVMMIQIRFNNKPPTGVTCDPLGYLFAFQGEMATDFLFSVGEGCFLVIYYPIGDNTGD